MKKRHAVIKSVLSSIAESEYDYMGRRYMQKVTENGTVTRHERYLYRGYLQIAALDILHEGKQMHALFWDPTEPLATRPLVLLASDDNRYTYAHDLTKNVTELLDGEGNIAAAYDYDPFGTVTATGPATHLNPIQWSSEVYDPELALVYYNYRHYNPADGRWINRDPIAEHGGWNLYGFVKNQISFALDMLGLSQKAQNHINPSCINCLGFAADVGGSLHPGSISMQELLSDLGWICEDVNSSDECQHDCKAYDYFMLFFYLINLENDPKKWKQEGWDKKGGFDAYVKHYREKIEKEKIMEKMWTEKGFWRLPSPRQPFKAQTRYRLDYHEIKRNCNESGERAWSFVGQMYKDKKIGFQNVEYIKDPDLYFGRNSNQVVKKKCCRKPKK